VEREQDRIAVGGSFVSTSLDAARAELASRCDVIEDCYEFMLAYAAQGLTTDVGSGSGAQVRERLRKSDAALSDLAAFLGRFVEQLGIEDPTPYSGFIAVLERDARDAQAAIRLVLVQPAISSQLVDNLNASIHLRALLTDLFLIDEVLKTHARIS
jgi:hypothetical protein